MRSLIFFVLSLSLPMTLFAKEEPVQRPNLLSVSIDIEKSLVSGALTVVVQANEEVRFETGSLRVLGTYLNGRPIETARAEGMLAVRPVESGEMEVRYEGTFPIAESIGNRNYGVISSVIDQRGVSLTGLWHPRPLRQSSWVLRATLPSGYEAVSEAEEMVRTVRGKTVEFEFRFPHAISSVDLVATDRYVISRERFGDHELLAYFFPEDRQLAGTYLRHAKHYMELYEKMLAPYPYARFVIVENFLPTGYSFPTFTLLGQDVVRLPFIVETSLGHEILHQWFGDSVFCDDSAGNWTEGLTTYLADQWYEEEKGKGWEYRKQQLVNYAAYVHGAQDVPLRQFRGRTDLASRSIGYGKCSMVFHMLRRSLGDERFFAALREFVVAERFRNASWKDIETIFEKHAGKDLSAFFHQWLDRSGLPRINVENVSVRRYADAYEISFDVKRKDLAVPVELPVVITSLHGGSRTEHVTIDADSQHRSLVVDEEPSSAVFDGDYDLARLPEDDEMPPVIARLIGDERPVVVPPFSGIDAYRIVIDGFLKQGGVEKSAAELKDADIRASTLVLLGAENPVQDRIFGGRIKREGGFSIVVRKNPWNGAKIVAIIDAASAGETEAAFGKIFHYGKYSSLVFDDGRNMEKRITSSDRGIIWDLLQHAAVLDMSLLRRMPSALDAAASKRIVYVGEYHDRFSNHAIELQVIRELRERNQALAVGMEMFQRPFQKFLDDYIAGTIDEREFLQKSEYFKRWGFDYNLYKPILDYCRSNKVPVVALNIRGEIVDKVSKGGIDSLSAEEHKELPAEMDFSNDAYRERIRQAFAQHQELKDRSFDFFLQAQVIWDETMAESIDRYLSNNPDRQLAVIAGGGHLVYGNGIPARAFRRNGLSHIIILNDADIDPGIADYVVFPGMLDGLTAPKLLLTFREEDGKLRVADFMRDSPAKKAGLKTGDAIVALDGVPVKGLQDIKIALFFKKPGDVVRVTVERERFLFGERMLTAEVKL